MTPSNRFAIAALLVLAANDLTTDQLEQLMYKVAQDSTLSAEYGRLTNR